LTKVIAGVLGYYYYYYMIYIAPISRIESEAMVGEEAVQELYR